MSDGDGELRGGGRSAAMGCNAAGTEPVVITGGANGGAAETGSGTKAGVAETETRGSFDLEPVGTADGADVSRNP